MKKLLRQLVEWMIRNELFSHHHYFKVGDLVTYNWKAKIVIDTVAKEHSYITKILTVKHKNMNYIESEDRTHGGTHWTSAFWLRHKYWWETFTPSDQIHTPDPD